MKNYISGFCFNLQLVSISPYKVPMGNFIYSYSTSDTIGMYYCMNLYLLNLSVDKIGDGLSSSGRKLDVGDAVCWLFTVRCWLIVS